MNSKLKEAKRSEDGKNANNLKIIARKEKEIEEGGLREGKLVAQLEAMKEEARKVEQGTKERVEQARRVEVGLRGEVMEAGKRAEKIAEEAASKIEVLNRKILSL